MPLSFAPSLRRLDGWQQRVPVLGIPVAVVKKFVDDGADRLGVQIAYWGFFSVFALLLVFASILGFVFQSHPDLQRQLLDSTLERMPVIGPQIRGDIGTLTGSGAALAVGAGRRAVDRPRRHARDCHRARSGLGRAPTEASRLCQLAAAGSTRAGIGRCHQRARDGCRRACDGRRSGDCGHAGARALSPQRVIDVVLFAASFRVLTAAHVTTRQVLPGALLAAGCWLGLQALGGVFVTKVLAGSSQTYGGFAAVIGLLSWLLIASELILIAAELNVVLARRLWPRSLTGGLLEADKQALRASAHAAQLDPRQQITVTFEQRGDLPHRHEADDV